MAPKYRSTLAAILRDCSRLTLTMAEAVDTRPVAEAVTDELNLQESPEVLLEDLSAEQSEYPVHRGLI